MSATSGVTSEGAGGNDGGGGNGDGTGIGGEVTAGGPAGGDTVTDGDVWVSDETCAGGAWGGVEAGTKGAGGGATMWLPAAGAGGPMDGGRLTVPLVAGDVADTPGVASGWRTGPGDATGGLDDDARPPGATWDRRPDSPVAWPERGSWLAETKSVWPRRRRFAGGAVGAGGLWST